MAQSLQAAIESLRPLHWMKSGFCLAALFFSGRADQWDAWLMVLPLVAAFSLLSSAGYLCNDLINAKEDRRHPRKRSRPIASGRLSKSNALALTALTLLSGLGILWVNYGAGLVSAAGVAYFSTTLSYSLVLRNVPVLDVLVISLGFVIRVAAGAFVFGVYPTSWLVVSTYLVSLMLGFGKRLGEQILLESRGDEGRIDEEDATYLYGFIFA